MANDANQSCIVATLSQMTSESEISEGISENLLQAVSQGQVEKVRKILDNQCLSIDDRCLLLHYTASCGQVKVARLLINDYKCPVDCRNDSKQTPLHIACRKGHLSLVRMLVSEHKADLNARDKDNNTPLNIAALHNYINVVKCLIDEFNCSPDTKGFIGRTAIHQACELGNVKLVEMLLTKYNLNPFSVDNYGNTPLHIAASAGREKVVNMLITKYECPVDCRNNSKQTPLHFACNKGHLSVVRMLVSEHNADLNARNENNNTPLHHAAFTRHTNIVRCLIDEFNCSPDTKGYVGMSVIHAACYSGNVELVEVLLTEYNLDPLSVDDNGNTPLHIAALAGKEEVANMLITKYKCPVDCRNNSKQTPLHIACLEGNLSVVRMLESEHKADLIARDVHYNTPLNYAAQGGHTYVVKSLIDEFSCSPYIKEFEGRTIFHQACYSGNFELVEMLYNLDPLFVDDNGDTPLHIAALAGRVEVANMLITKYKCPVDCRNNSKQTPLHHACFYGHLSVVRALASEHKADLNAHDEHNTTPLYYAVLIGHTNVVKCLIDEFNCSPEIKGFEGKTTVHQACESGNVELVEMLLTKYNLDPLSVDDNGDTPLHIAALAGREEVANMLITKYKCPVDCRNNSKRTPLHLACGKGHLSLVRLLVSEHNADLNACDEHNTTPLTHAALGGHSNVMQSNLGTNIFLVVVNLTKDIHSINDELGYWFSFISYNKIFKQCTIILIGSHADLVSDAESGQKIEFMKPFEHDLEATCKIIDCLSINCRKPRSSKCVQSSLLKTISSAPEYSLTEEAAILLGLLEKDFKDVVTCDLQTLLSQIEDTGIHLPNTANSLYPLVEELHTVGLLMIIRREGDKLEDCLLLLGISKLTNEVHQILFSDASTQKHDKKSHCHGASMGILPYTFLKEILPEYISIDCLVQLQYCQEINHAEVKFDHSIVPTEDPSAPRLLYFPALCTAERKKSIITPDDYTYSIGWFAECQSKFDYFPSRYLHVLLLRLAFSFAHPVTPCAAEGESEHVVDVLKSNCRCTMWKNGIHWHMEEGVECIVELVNNSKGLVVITKSRIEEERKCKCTEMLIKIIDLAVQAKEEFCHTITLKEFLMPLDPKDTSSFRERDNLFDLRDLDRVLREGKPVVLSITGKQKVESSCLAHLKVHFLTGTWSSVISYVFIYNL